MESSDRNAADNQRRFQEQETTRKRLEELRVRLKFD
jgi:hypothetical protein